ncbi:hypothetical protein WISP_01817 [Willisornis vidua]|uniref:RRM domain-containing protein n=1 Tax=Willisornis vidua TaxID=1566151 RepID=A0ABQ9DYY4_9PASS|nr:hypothetical protein WISP_01817 [Willisornis vidua]
MAKGLCLNGRKRPAGQRREERKRRKVDGGGPGPGPEERSCRLSAALLGEDCEISQEQLYELLKYAALGKCHNAAQPSWCRVHHQSHLAGVVVVVLHEMSQVHFYRFYLHFKHLRKVFRHRFTLTPSANFLTSLYGEGADTDLRPQNTAPGLTSTSSECVTKSSDLQCDPIIRRYGEKKRGLTSYTLTVEEQKKNDYPIKGSPGCKDYISTECDQQRTDSSPLFGLDCEMMIHPSVIDTSLLFARDEGRRFKLKFLAKAVLGKEIQCEQRLGHDPTEDARAALELAQFFIEQGPAKILQRAMEEVPLSTFSIIQFSLGPEYIASHLHAGLHEKVRSKLTDMLTIYAGPFEESFCVKSVKKEFGRCGPIQSLTVVTETFQPYVRVQYEVLEAAQLAVESLNGAEVAGSCIKVQRPVTAAMLDCDVLIKELELDVENEGVIYVAGLKKSLTETDLQEEFSHLKDLETLFLPKDPQSGKHRNCCFLKFQKSQSAVDALEAINGWTIKGSELRSRNALASGHLWRWIWQMNHSNGKQGKHIFYEQMEQLSDCLQVHCSGLFASGVEVGNCCVEEAGADTGKEEKGKCCTSPEAAAVNTQEMLMSLSFMTKFKASKTPEMKCY